MNLHDKAGKAIIVQFTLVKHHFQPVSSLK